MLNALTDTRKSITVPRYKKVQAHPKFFLCLTCNEGYAGTVMQNTAFLSRFTKFSFHYPESIAELLNSPQADKINKLYETLLQKVQEEHFSPECLFVRSYIRLDELLNYGGNDSVCIRACLTNKIPRRTEAEAINILWDKLLA